MANTEAERRQALIELLWDSMKRDKEHKDCVRTGWGTKTKTGLVASIERIFSDNPMMVEASEGK